MNRDKATAGRGRSHHGRKEASNLLEALEKLRVELGSVGEDLITIMREAGVTPPEEPASDEGSPGKG